MSIITTLEENIKKEHQKNWYFFLSLEKHLVELNFDWIELAIHEKSKSLIGKGKLRIGDKNYNILLSYSPFHNHRYDRVIIDDSTIKFNKHIHLYNDLSLCLYHPVIDKPYLKTIPLYKMIPWISEWIIFYEQWKKYGVWLGKEIKH
jgi:hypothetical protein